MMYFADLISVLQCAPLGLSMLVHLTTPLQGGQKRGHTLPFPLTSTSLNFALGLSLESTSLESLFWSLQIELGALNI